MKKVYQTTMSIVSKNESLIKDGIFFNTMSKTGREHETELTRAVSKIALKVFHNALRDTFELKTMIGALVKVEDGTAVELVISVFPVLATEHNFYDVHIDEEQGLMYIEVEDDVELIEVDEELTKEKTEEEVTIDEK